MQQKSLRNPPIKEAIISVSFKRGETKETIEKVLMNSELNQLFQVNNKVVKFQIKLEGELQSETSHEEEGFVLGNSDNTEVFQIRLGQISYHTTKYKGWDNFSQSFKKAWEIYTATVDENTVAELSVRFINLIALPQPITDLREYTLVQPHFPNSVSKAFNNFFIQINVANEDGTLNGIVTETLDIRNAREVYLLFDVSAHSQKQLSTKDMELWDVLEKLREFKNTIFFESITEKSLSQYE